MLKLDSQERSAFRVPRSAFRVPLRLEMASIHSRCRARAFVYLANTLSEHETPILSVFRKDNRGEITQQTKIELRAATAKRANAIYR